MNNKKRIFAAIDLKSFYASVECRERKLDPLDINLVVADESRTSKTICLAVSPALKTFGIPGRPRLFEVIKRLQEVNHRREKLVGKSEGKSYSLEELKKNVKLEVPCFDKKGDKIGDAVDTIDSLEKNKKWEFRAVINSGDVKSCKVKDSYVSAE